MPTLLATLSLSVTFLDSQTKIHTPFPHPKDEFRNWLGWAEYLDAPKINSMDHTIIEHPKLEGTHKDHWVQCLVPHKTTQNQTTCLKVLSKCFLHSGRLGAIPLPCGAWNISLKYCHLGRSNTLLCIEICSGLIPFIIWNIIWHFQCFSPGLCKWGFPNR